MAIVLGIDLGTTSITALALETETGDVLTTHSVSNQAETTSAADRKRGWSEWDAELIVARGLKCMREVAESLGVRSREVAGIGLTGQQHGGVVIDRSGKPLTPFINWQDRRGLEPYPGTGRTYVDEVRSRLGNEIVERTGCRLSSGYLGTTLFWLQANDRLPSEGTACFIMDYFGAVLTGRTPVTEPTCAGSGGVFDVVRRHWDTSAIEALGLPISLFPSVQEADRPLGATTEDVSEKTGFAAGIPVFPAIGDNQASFLGSVADRQNSLLVNVGTGGQVAVFTEAAVKAFPLEIRPFPLGGNLLVNAGLSGGWSYRVLENFFRQVGDELFETPIHGSIYERMTRLAQNVPRGADGLQCEPYFSGTRANPELRGAWTGISPQNFTPGHMARALLEGMARGLHAGYQQIREASGTAKERLIGAGNGLRENPLLAGCVADRFGSKLWFSQHREEAAFGAALIATVGSGCRGNLVDAGELIRYESVEFESQRQIRERGCDATEGG